MKYGLLLAALALVMAWLYGMIDYAGEFAYVDLRHYRAMADAAPAIDPAVRRPFAHRILGPWLAGVLPMPDPLAFRLLSTALLVASTLLLFRFARTIGIAAGPSALAAALFTFNPYWFGFVAFNPFQVADAISFALIAGALIAVRRNNLRVFSLLLLLGALTREPVILVAPAAVLWWYLERDRGHAAYLVWALAALPAIAAFIIVRAAIPAPGAGLLEALVAHVDKALNPATWYRLLVNSYAPLSLLPLVFWRTTGEFARRHPDLLLFAALVFVSAFFGGDQERLMAPAFITAYALIALILRDQFWAHRWALWLITAAAFATSLHHLTARFPLPSRTATIVVSAVALAVVTATAIIIRQRQPDEGEDLSAGRKATSPART